jgi:UDP-N-acetylmuramoyl-L-alanyl-D-glutamate--2,6-diaminopimelate ligase
MADFRTKIIEMLPDGMLLHIDNQEVWVKFTGGFNAYNLTTVYAAATLLGIDKMEVLTTLSKLTPVAGRFETIIAEDRTMAIVDYAHTPDALENVLQTIEEVRQGDQRLIVVCGCGGDRDRTKRPEMASIAVREATTAILTSDNPRTEAPEAILDDMVAGVGDARNYLRITDRREAIRTAAMLAKAGDIILIAGKGHEDYQIIGTVKHHFDDREEIRAAFEQSHNN